MHKQTSSELQWQRMITEYIKDNAGLSSENNALKIKVKRYESALKCIALSEKITWKEVIKRPHNYVIAKQALNQDNE